MPGELRTSAEENQVGRARPLEALLYGLGPVRCFHTFLQPVSKIYQKFIKIECCYAILV